MCSFVGYLYQRAQAWKERSKSLLMAPREGVNVSEELSSVSSGTGVTIRGGVDYSMELLLCLCGPH